MGRLEARVLIEGAPAYDPKASFRRVKNGGALPWDGVVEHLDRLAGARVAPVVKPLTPLPNSDGPVTMRAAEQGPPEGQPLSTSQPTNPGVGQDATPH